MRDWLILSSSVIELPEPVRTGLRGRPRTINNMKAYKATKAKKYRADKKAKKSAAATGAPAKPGAADNDPETVGNPVSGSNPTAAKPSGETK